MHQLKINITLVINMQTLRKPHNTSSPCISEDVGKSTLLRKKGLMGVRFEGVTAQRVIVTHKGVQLTSIGVGRH